MREPGEVLGTVQHFDSALDVVADILRERGRASPEHVNATQLVDIMDSEAMLQMGMLANYAEVCLELTRFFCEENVRHRFGTPDAWTNSKMSANRAAFTCSGKARRRSRKMSASTSSPES